MGVALLGRGTKLRVFVIVKLRCYLAPFVRRTLFEATSGERSELGLDHAV